MSLQIQFASEKPSCSQDTDCDDLAMEDVENGKSLDSVQSNGRISEDQAHRYFSQLMWALDDLQTEHRGLKCENILLDCHLNIRVIDFGPVHQRQLRTGRPRR
jgi:serine/threonine protein kinase